MNKYEEAVRNRPCNTCKHLNDVYCMKFRTHKTVKEYDFVHGLVENSLETIGGVPYARRERKYKSFIPFHCTWKGRYWEQKEENAD